MSELRNPLSGLIHANSELSYCFSGEEHCSPGYSWGPGIRNEYIFHYIASGCGTYKVNGQIYPLQAGQGFVIFPGTPVYYEASATSPWHYIWVGFKGGQAPAFLQRAGIAHKRPIFQPSEYPEEVQLSITELLTADTSRTNQDLLMMAYLYRLLWALCESGSRGGLRTEDTRYKAAEQHLAQAFEYIYWNYSRAITIKEIADYVNVDRKHLHAIFKRAGNLSPKTYLTWYRMKMACELLRRNDLKIEEVARSVGYTDSLQFSKVFRKHYGKPPTVWRKSLLEPTEADA